MNLLRILIPSVIVKCIFASSAVSIDVLAALEEDGFKGIKDNLELWKDRKDLFDNVVAGEGV